MSTSICPVESLACHARADTTVPRAAPHSTYRPSRSVRAVRRTSSRTVDFLAKTHSGHSTDTVAPATGDLSPTERTSPTSVTALSLPLGQSMRATDDALAMAKVSGMVPLSTIATRARGASRRNESRRAWANDATHTPPGTSGTSNSPRSSVRALIPTDGSSGRKSLTNALGSGAAAMLSYTWPTTRAVTGVCAATACVGESRATPINRHITEAALPNERIACLNGFVWSLTALKGSGCTHRADRPAWVRPRCRTRVTPHLRPGDATAPRDCSPDR